MPIINGKIMLYTVIVSCVMVTVIVSCVKVSSVSAQMRLAEIPPKKVSSLFFKHKQTSYPGRSMPAWKKCTIDGKQSITLLPINTAVWLSWDIPANTKSFSSILFVQPKMFYTHKRNMTNYGYGKKKLRERVKFMVRLDGKVVYECLISAGDPKRRVVIPTRGARVLEIGNKPLVWGQGHWIGPSFSEKEPDSLRVGHILEAGNEFLTIGESLYGYYHRGDPVALEFATNRDVGRAKINIKVMNGDKLLKTRVLNMRLNADLVGNHSGKVMVKGLTDRCGVITLRGAVQGGDVTTIRTIGVMVKPEAPSEFSNPPIFANHSDTTYGLFNLPYLSFFGFHWVRTTAHWRYIEPHSGHFRFKFVDYLLDQAEAQHAKVIYCLGHDVPKWAAVIPPDSRFSSRVRIKHLESWKKYVSKTIEHYKGRVAAWQLYNELDCKRWTRLDEVKIIKSAYSIIKKLDPDTPAIGLGGSQHGVVAEYIPLLLTRGLAEYSDGLSIHYYPSAPPEQVVYQNNLNRASSYLGLLGEVGKTMRRGNIKGGIWMTETNYLREPNKNPADILNKADWFSRQFILSVASGQLRAFCIHSPLNVCRLHPMARLILMQTATAAKFVDGSKFVKRIDCGDPHVYAYLFQKKHKQCLAIWSTTREKIASVTGLAESCDLFDGMGNEEMKISGKISWFRVSQTPRYLTGNKLENIQLRIWEEVVFSLEPTRFIAGEPGHVVIKWTHLSEMPGTAEFILMTPGWSYEPKNIRLNLVPGKTYTLKFTTTVPIDSDFKNYPLILKVIGQQKSRSVKKAVQVISPLDVSIKPFDTSKITAGVSIDLLIKNIGGAALTGIVGLKDTPAFSEQFGPIASGTSITAKLFIKSEQQKNLNLVIACPNYHEISINKSLLSCLCIKASESVAIDGVLDEWRYAQKMEMKDVVELSADPTGHSKGPDDLSAVFRTMWDEKYFYLAVKVRDNKHKITGKNNNQYIYNDDSIQFAFDPLALKVKRGYYLYGIALRRYKSTLVSDYWRWQANTCDKTVDASNRHPSGIKCKVLRTKGFTTYEAAIPWKELAPFKPVPGQIARFSILVNDNDGFGRRRWVEWASGIGRKADPTLFGDIYFK